jgi:hypothetical protein
MGLKLFMTLVENGEAGFGALLDGQMELGRYFRDGCRSGLAIAEPHRAAGVLLHPPGHCARTGTPRRVLQRLYAKATSGFRPSR